MFLFKPSATSFEKIHGAERSSNGTYFVPYSEFLKLRKKTRLFSSVAVVVLIFSLSILSIYFPYIWNRQPEDVYAMTTISSSVGYSSNTTTNDDVTIANGGTVTLTGGITWTINGALTVQSGGSIVFQETGGTYTTYPTLSVSGNVTVDSGGTIHSNAKGFPGGAAFANGSGPGGGVYGAGNQEGGGGGNGGAGGRGNESASTGGVRVGLATPNTSASTLAPTIAGSGGGGGSASGAAIGGAGGGVIRIDSGGTITVNGTVSANGGNGADAGRTPGGGAGGSIYLTAAGLNGTGSGSLTATGGRGGNSGSYPAGGGGGGGRIAAYFNTPGASISTLKTNSSVLGGVGGDGTGTSDGFVGQVGTLFFLDVDNKDIDIYNGPDFFQESDTITLSGTQATFTGTPKFGDSDTTTNDNDAVFDNANSTTQFDDITIAADAYVESKIGSGNTIFNLSINYTGTFTITSPSSTDGSCRSFTGTTAQDTAFDTCFVVEQVTLTGPTLTINTNGQLYADGYGNTGGAQNANGNGTGGGVYGANVSGGGAGHGGAGGNGSGSGATGGIAHGTNTAPVTAGSGGGGGSASSSAIGGNGGGIIRVTLSSAATINGTISADGTNAPDVNGRTGGGGSGGSIYLTVPGTLAGSGAMTATGGRGGDTANYPAGGGGGGGRIAYYYVTLTYSGSATVTAGIGGNGTGASDGVAGTDGTTYTYQYAVPSTPSITAPTNGTNNASLTPTITSSAFSGDLTHTSSDWQVDDNSDFSSTTFSSATDTTNLTSIAVSPALSPNTTYYARMRHNNAAGNSTWATSVSFTTVANAPSAPTLTASSATTLGVTINVNSNPASTEFAIQETGSSNYVQTDGTLSGSAAWQTNANWGTKTVTGLSVSTSYTFQVKARNSASVETSFSSTASLYTLANAPGTPTVNGATTTTLNVTLSTNSNPSTVEFAIQETGSSNYVQTDGTLSGSVAWQTNANWGTKTVTGLSVGTQYTFQVKARNGNNTETAFGSTASLYTLANAPSAPTVNTPATSSLKVIVAENSNPSSTEFAIQETITGFYVKADGTMSDATAVWQTKTNWGGASGVTVSGLSPNVQYTFKVKARNGNNIETDFSSTASLYTAANIPSAPTLSSPTVSGMTVVVNVNSNPASTEFAIQETGSSNYLQTDGTLSASAVWQNITNWGGVSGKIVSGLSVNTSYTFKVKARNGNSTETDFSSTASLYTAANIPSAPTLNTPSTSSIKVIINENSNPSTVGYALQETTSGNYIQTNGTLSASAAWQTYTNWGGASGVTVSGLSPNVQYTFKVKARNGNSTETDFSSTASLYTSSGVPGTPTLSNISTTSLIVVIDSATNPAGTEFAIQETTSGNYIQTNGTLSASAAWQTYTNWGGASGSTLTGLSANTAYTFRVKSRSGDNVESDVGEATSGRTLANAPGVPTVNTPALSSLKVVLDVNSNPASTEFAIQETGSTNYIQADGTLLTGEVWQTYANWGSTNGVSVSGLSSNTSYVFKVKARNASNVETSFSSTTSLYTLARAPGTPTLSMPTSSSLTLVIDVNSNGTSTEFAIQETGSSNYVQTDGTLSATVAWQNITNWGGVSGKIIIGLSANTQYIFKVKARNGNSTETDFSSTSSLYSAATVPSAPSVSSPTATTLKVILGTSTDANDPQFAIQETTSGNYVQTNGTLSTSAAWQTYTNWGGASGVTVSGLSPNASYTFKVKARNTEQVETSFSSTNVLTTTANTPGTPTFGNFTASALDLILSLNGNPESTEFSIQENSAQQYLQGSGSLSAGEVFQTYLQWGGSAGKTILGLLADTLYTFLIKARNADGVTTTASSFTSPTRTLASIPGTPTLVGEVKSDQATVTFSANSNPSTVVYAIYSSTASGYVQESGRLASQTVWQSYSAWTASSGVTITGLQSNTDYSFQVKAKNSDAVETNLSSALTLKTAAGGSAFKIDSVPPSMPKNFTVTEQNDRTVLLAWTDPPERDLDSILILRSTSTFPLGGNPYTIVNKGEQYYIDQGISPEEKFNYQLQAKDRVGNLSELTTIKSITTSPPPPPSPSIEEEISASNASDSNVSADSSSSYSPSATDSSLSADSSTTSIITNDSPPLEETKEIPISTYELIVPTDSLPKETLITIDPLKETTLISLNIPSTNIIWGDVHELRLIDIDTKLESANKLQKYVIVKISLRPGFLKENSLDWRRLVLSKWNQEEAQWKDFPVSVSTEEGILYAQTKETGIYAVRVTENINKWSSNQMAQITLPPLSTPEGVFAEIFRLPQKFTARPNRNTRGPFGWAYNLITLTDGLHTNLGSLQKKIELSLRYDLDFTKKYDVSCDRIILMRYDSKIKKWESVPTKNLCRLGVLQATIEKLGVYAAMIMNVK